jgi:hypothetical protein
MALIFCDGFDHYATAQLFEKWNSGGGNIVSGGRDGQGLNVSDNYFVGKNLPSNASTLIVGCAFNQSTTGNRLLLFADTGNAQCSVICNPDGSLGALDAFDTVLGTSAPGIAYADTFQYLEAKITFASSGSVDIHLDGISVLSLSGVNTSAGTGNAYANIVELYANGSVIFDDSYICDATRSCPRCFKPSRATRRRRHRLPHLCGKRQRMVYRTGFRALWSLRNGFQPSL